MPPADPSPGSRRHRPSSRRRRPRRRSSTRSPATSTTRAARGRRAPATCGRSTARSVTPGASCSATARASSPGACTSATAWRASTTTSAASTGATPPTGTTSRAGWATGSTRCPPSAPSPRPTPGRVGHVAWVSDIGPGTVTIEEYNYGSAGGYGTRTVPVGDFRYLHLADVAPSPLVGSDRPVVSVPDGLGGSWTARVDDRGTLLLTAPGRPARVVGRRGAFTPVVAPALSLDHHGRPWVAATTRDGRVIVGTTRRGRAGPARRRHLGPDREPGARPVAHPRPVLATVSAEGTLVTRRLTREGRWTRPDRVGRAGVLVDPQRTRARQRRHRPHVARGRRVARSDLRAVPRARTPPATPRTGRVAHLDARPHHRRRRHHPAAPGQRGRPARRTHARRSSMEPSDGAGRRVVAVRLPRRRRRSPAACTWPPPTAPAPSSSRSTVPGRPSRTRRCGARPHPLPRAGDPPRCRALRRRAHRLAPARPTGRGAGRGPPTGGRLPSLTRGNATQVASHEPL